MTNGRHRGSRRELSSAPRLLKRTAIRQEPSHCRGVQHGDLWGWIMNPGTQPSVAIQRVEIARRFAVVLFLPFVMACGGPAPTAPDPAFLRFNPRAPESGSPESVTAVAEQGQIAIRATLSGPDPCRTLQGVLDQRNRELTLRV